MILLSRILKYLNGALAYDDDYRFCAYVVGHYLDMETITKERILREAGIRKENMEDFIGRLGCDFDWEAFHTTFVQHHYMRLDQIRERMLDLSPMELVRRMYKEQSDEEMLEYISMICRQIDSHRRTVLVGALYPMSIAVEFQTDLITFGQNVVQFHNFDPTMHFSGDDLIIFISATGRAMDAFLTHRNDLHPERADSLMITQNPAYTMEEHKISDYVIKLPGRYGGLDFNYQLMQIFDLLRIQYYHQHYLGED